MSSHAVERTPAPSPAAPDATRADSAQRPARAPEGPPALRLLPSAPAPPTNVPREVGAVLRSPGPGASLPAPVGGAIGASFGVDVSPVRVHADATAAGAAGAVSARAFTYGSHVYLGAGETVFDLPLVAHEFAHVVQQQSAPAVQLFGGGPDPGPLEHEAQRASAAVVAGRPALVVARTTPAIQRQFGWIRRAAGAVAGAVRTAASAVAEGAAGLLARAVNFIKERARSIPGYDLVAFALGRDPVTQEPVERNATNLVRAVVGLIPGGAAIFQNLQQSGAIQRAFEWATTELERLGLTWPVIRGAVSRFLDTLGPSDLLNLGGVFDRARAIFGPILSRAVQFAVAAGKKLFQFIFEAVMASAGGQRILGLFRRIGETFELIVSDPVRFIGNLVNAIKGGFQRFAANIVSHLRTALFEWLLGALRGVLTLPSRWDLAGIVSVIVQILGLTYQALRARLVRLIGERAVGYIETAFEWIQTIVTRGLSAAWERLVEFATGLVDTVVEGIRNWVAQSIVGAAVTRLVTMFNPVGAIIQSIIAIYNTIMFFVERAQQIAALVEAIVDSISNIARGNIGAAVSYVERTMARFLPVLISFLARLIGLGNISGTIREIIGRIRGVVDRAIDRVVDWVVARVRGIIARLTGRGAAEPAAGTSAAANEAYIHERQVGSHTVRIRRDLRVFRFSDPVPVTGDPAQQTQQAALESKVPRQAVSYPVTSLNRARGPFGHVQGVKDAEGRESLSARGMPGYLPGDQRGHLIGDRFHGSNQLNNLVPMASDLNLSTFKTYENRLANRFKALTNAKKAVLLFMRVTPTYPSNDPSNPMSFRPTTVAAESKIITLKDGATELTVEEQTENSGALDNPRPGLPALAINAADEGALRGYRLNPELVRVIIADRTRYGRFRNWENVESRLVLRLGDQSHLIQELTAYEIAY